MATQQAMPATANSACSALGDRPSAACERRATAAIWVSSWSGGRRFSVSASGIIVARQKAAAERLGRTPAVLADHQLDDRRPEGAGDVVARGGDGDGHAAA